MNMTTYSGTVPKMPGIPRVNHPVRSVADILSGTTSLSHLGRIKDCKGCCQFCEVWPVCGSAMFGLVV